MKKHKFCCKCGSRLVIDPMPHSFSPYSGEPYFLLRCPKYEEASYGRFQNVLNREANSHDTAVRLK